MKPFLIQQLERYALRLTELDFLLSREDIMADMTQFLKLSREHAEVSAVASRFARFQQRTADLSAAQAMLDDADLREMAEEEVASASAELQTLEGELQRMLLPKDPDDARPAFVEIRAGTGGDESALFAGDLLRMYTRYAESQGWKCEIVSESVSELGGYKEVVVRIEGEQVYGALKFESGGHRVQRVPATETQGRIHTSACTVAVLAEPAAMALAQQHFDLDPEHDFMQDITYLVRQPEFVEYLHESNFSEPLVMRPARHGPPTTATPIRTSWATAPASCAWPSSPTVRSGSSRPKSRASRPSAGCKGTKTAPRS